MTGDGLDGVYREYLGDPKVRARWSSENPGNRLNHRARNAGFRQALEDLASAHGIRRVLELGCGDGQLLVELAAMPPLEDAGTVGVDILGFRLDEGRSAGDRPPLVQADGQLLPFRDETFDLVVMATVLSSIDNEAINQRLTREVDRVLRAGGAVLWYDMRVGNPANRHVRPVRRKELELRFPDYGLEVRSVTLVPQIARRLGRFSETLYPWLARLPLARSHLLGLLRKP